MIDPGHIDFGVREEDPKARYYTGPDGEALHVMALEPKWLYRARKFAAKIRDSADTRTNELTANAQALAGGMDTVAKLAEVGQAYLSGYDPERLNWDATEGGDTGWDVMFGTTKIDVKSLDDVGKRYLLWPYTQVERYRGKDFDCLSLILVETDKDDWSYCYYLGCVTKDRFRRECEECKGISGITDGTLRMDKDQLNDPLILKKKKGE